MLTGYARVSTGGQTSDPQAGRLRAAAVKRIFTRTPVGHKL